MHLIVAKYSDDAERKRIEYALERWKSSMDISKPEGIVVIVEGKDIEDMLEDLYARISKESIKDNIKVYNLSAASLEVEQNEKLIKIDLEGEMETIEKFIGFVLAKQKALLKRDTPTGKLYEVYTKKGRATISTSLKPVDGNVSVNIRVEGYGGATELVHDKIASELEYFKEV